jgi:hypothetical protein
MRITLDNFNEVRQKILESGIDHVEYDSDQKLQFIVLKSGDRFEFTEEAFEQFKKAGLLRRGIRAKKNL